MKRPEELEDYLQAKVTQRFKLLHFGTAPGIVEVVYQGDRLMIAPMYGWRKPMGIRAPAHMGNVYRQMAHAYKSWFRLVHSRRAVVPLTIGELFHLTQDGLIGTTADVQYLALHRSERLMPYADFRE